MHNFPQEVQNVCHLSRLCVLHAISKSNWYVTTRTLTLCRVFYEKEEVFAYCYLHKWREPFMTCMAVLTLFVRFLTVYVSVSTLPCRPLSYGFCTTNLLCYVQKNPHVCSTTNQGQWFQIEAETLAPCRWLSCWRGVVFASFRIGLPLFVSNEGLDTLQS